MDTKNISKTLIALTLIVAIFALTACAPKVTFESPEKATEGYFV